MKRKRPPGPELQLFPLLMSMTQWMPKRYPLDPLGFAEANAQFGDIAHYRVGPLHVYQIHHPDLARQIAVDEPEKYYKPKLVKHALRVIGGNGLVTSDGALWKRQRKLMQPAFRHDQLGTYAAIMTDQTRKLIGTYRDGEVRDIGADMMQLTLGIVVKSLFGTDLPREARDIGGLLGIVQEAANRRLNTVLEWPSWVPTPRNLREKRAIGELDAVLLELIEARRKSQEKPDDLLSVLLAATDAESGAGMSDRQLRDEMMTLFMAGHDTTANTLTWTWYLLSRHPQVEAKLADELRSVLAGRTPSANDLSRLPYTEMVIRESMRLYPVAPGFAREPVEDVRIGGYDVPKGSLIVISTWALHRDAKFFPEPQKFEPERFSPGWEDRIPRYAYLPFGAGPRVCIGNGFAMMEARLVLATMAQTFRLSAASADPIAPMQKVIVRPSAPVRLKVTSSRPS